MTVKKDELVNSIKVWIFPTLVAILGTMIWTEITEIKKDVKLLLAQSNIDKTRIDNLQMDVRQLEQAVFSKKTASQTVELPMFMKLYFKPEEIFDVKKYIKQQT